MKKLYLLFLTLFCCSCAIAGSITDIVFFGDSLTDNGNIYKILLKIAPKSPPYFRGRFANGPVWSEDVGKYYYDKSYLNYVIYAYGGATAVPHFATTKFIPPCTLELELNRYVVDTPFKDKSKALFLVWIGGNDYIFYSFQDVDELTSRVVDKTIWAIKKLINSGGKNFVVLNLPDLSKIPYAHNYGLEGRLHEMSVAHNKKLIDSINRIRHDFPDVNIAHIDTYGIFNDFLRDPDVFNKKYNAKIKETTEACWKGGYVFASLKNTIGGDLEHSIAQHSDGRKDIPTYEMKEFIEHSPALMNAYTMGKSYSQGVVPCTNPEEHFFWDSIHPSQVVHRILGEIVVDAIRSARIPV